MVNEPTVLTASRGDLSLALDPARAHLLLSQGPADWMIRCNGGGFAHLGFAEGKSVLGGEGNVPITWRRAGHSVLLGKGELPDRSLSFRLGFELPINGTLSCWLELSGPAVKEVLWVVFPAGPELHGEQSFLVFPQWLGLLVPARGEDFAVRRTVWQRPWCMRWLGGTQKVGGKDYSYLAFATDSLYRGVDLWRNSKGLGFNYFGERSAAEAKEDFRVQSMEFRFLEGNYVQLAKEYRTWRQGQSDWKTLSTRFRAPSPERVAGAQLFAHVPCDYGGEPLPFEALIPRMEALKAAGLDRALFHLGGWNRLGYDSEYPDILPANPKCGGDEGFRALTDAIDRLGYIATPHDDVAIISERAPSFSEDVLARLPNGEPFNFGVYREQQYRLPTAAAQTAFAQRNLAELRKRFPSLRGYLFDVATSYQPIEDYAYDPPQPKEAELKQRQGPFRIAREQFAQLVFSESIMDWALQYCDGAFMAEEGYWHKGDGGWSQDALHGIIVPLWDLVYHDAFLAIRESTAHVNTPMETEDPLVRYLRIALKCYRAGALPPCFYSDALDLSMLDSYRTQSTTDCGGWSKLSTQDLLLAVDHVSMGLGDAIFTQPMLSHGFIGGDLYHERTTFATYAGPVTVLVNTALEPWQVDDQLTLPALGFYIQGPNLVAYHASKVAGITLSEPTLIVWRYKLKGQAGLQVYRAFGEQRVPIPTKGKVRFCQAPEAGRVQEALMED